MPIFSFLAYPVDNQKETLIKELSEIPCCEITPSENEDVIIVLLDTPDEQTNAELINTIKNLKSIQSLNMAFGHSE